MGCVPALLDNPAREADEAVPEAYPSSLRANNTTSTSNLAQQRWNTFFADPHLRALIGTALANNQELKMSLQEALIAKYEIMARTGEYQPRVGAGAHVGSDKVGRDTPQGRANEASGVPEPTQMIGAGVSASWEVDVFKKLRNAAGAARFRYLASLEGRKFIITQLVAEIARAYYELVALDRQLEVLESNIELQRSALEVVRLEKQAGRVTQLAVQRFEAEMLKNQSSQFQLEQRIVEVENLLNFLVGRFPQRVPRDSRGLDRPLPDVVQTGIPSQLLENRPDVKQAELQLEAAKLDVKAAKARFYPSLSIDAGVGYESFNAAHLVRTPDSLFYGVGANITAPLLNRKAIEADYNAANAEQLHAVLNYERAILRAFTDVANQLSMAKNLNESYQRESAQVETLNRSVDVSNILFRSARADYMEVLLTRRDALESQMDLIETRLRQHISLVNIYHALGGGWRGVK